MIRTVEHYREGIKDGRDIRKDGERFKNVATHPAFKPIIDVNSCMFDTAHEPGHANAIPYGNGDQVNFIFYRPPMQNSVPIFKADTCSFDCRLVDYKDSVHTAFCWGEVVALVSNAKSPLIYFDRAFPCPSLYRSIDHRLRRPRLPTKKAINHIWR